MREVWKKINDKVLRLAAPAGAAAGGEYALPAFPKEFHRKFSDHIDKRYYSIFFCSSVLVLGTLLGMQNVQIYDPDSVEAQEALKKQFVQLVLKEDYVEPEPVVEEKPQEAAEEEAPAEEEEKPEEKTREEKREEAKQSAKKTQAQLAEERKARREARRSKRKKMQDEVSSQGVLGVLTAKGGGGTGVSYNDVLGDVGAGDADLDATLSSTGGLRSARGRGDRTKARGGGRGGGKGGNIDDLVADVGAPGSAEIGGRKGSFSLSKPSMSGRASKSASRNGDAIQQVIANQQSAIQYCYQQEARKNPNLKGEIKIKFTILYSGKVKSAKVTSSTLKNSKVERCVTQKIKRLKFAAIDRKQGNLTVTQTFSFGA